MGLGKVGVKGAGPAECWESYSFISNGLPNFKSELDPGIGVDGELPEVWKYVRPSFPIDALVDGAGCENERACDSKLLISTWPEPRDRGREGARLPGVGEWGFQTATPGKVGLDLEGKLAGNLWLSFALSCSREGIEFIIVFEEAPLLDADTEGARLRLIVDLDLGLDDCE